METDQPTPAVRAAEALRAAGFFHQAATKKFADLQDEKAAAIIDAHVPAEARQASNEAHGWRPIETVMLGILMDAIANGDERRVFAYATRYFAMKADFLKAAHCRDQLKRWGSTLPDDLGWLEKEAQAIAGDGEGGQG